MYNLLLPFWFQCNSHTNHLLNFDQIIHRRMSKKRLSESSYFSKNQAAKIAELQLQAEKKQS